MVCLVGHFHLHQHITGKKASLALHLAATAHLHDLFGRHEYRLEKLAETLGGGLLFDRLGYPLFEVRIGVNDVPALGHIVLSCLRLHPEENFIDTPLQNGIDDEEEYTCERHHDHHHDGSDQGFAARRPSDLVGLLAHLLNELKWICSCHFQPLAGAEGLEPPTCGFGDRRSTN